MNKNKKQKLLKIIQESTIDEKLKQVFLSHFQNLNDLEAQGMKNLITIYENILEDIVEKILYEKKVVKELDQLRKETSLPLLSPSKVQMLSPQKIQAFKNKAKVIFSNKNKAFEFFMTIGPEGILQIENELEKSFLRGEISLSEKEFHTGMKYMRQFRTKMFTLAKKYHKELEHFIKKELKKAEQEKKKLLQQAEKDIKAIARKYGVKLPA